MDLVVTLAIPVSLLAYPELVRAVIPDVAERARTAIIRNAQERLTTSTEDYVQGVRPVELHMPSGRDLPAGEFLAATIALVGWLPNAVEHGWPGGDMKPWLLAGRNAKMGKDGPYNVVPIRHGWPGAGGKNFTPMGAAYGPGFRLTPGGVEGAGSLSREAAAKLGRAVHRAAKKLEATTSHPDTGTKWGGRLEAGVGGAGLLRPHHKTDIYAGMVREEKTYARGTQNQFTTFRAVSVNSDPRAWIHPGIEGHHLFEGSRDEIGRDAAILFRQALAQAR